ncbi:MAG: hypothetical protein JJT81_07275 [Rubellimicrobium sp.]|nr:hypothetical protein [Rubellimicrobium sp.]
MGRDKKNEKRPEHFAALTRRMMETDAWRALSPSAQALYPWLKLEWHGPRANNNDSIQLSVRQAAEKMGCNVNTAARAFHELQRKGFIVVTVGGCLGLAGFGKSTQFQLTELPTLGESAGNHLFLLWRCGHDFPVVKAVTSNPKGENGRRKSRPEIEDDSIIKVRTFRKGAS